MRAPLLLSVHELRALARLEGLVLPAFATEADEDDPVVDLVALRGLVARGLVALAGDEPADGVALDPALADLLAPARDAALVVEVDEEVGTEARTWGAAGSPDGPCTTVAERPGGVVEVAGSEHPSLAVVAAAVGLDEVAPDPAPDGFVVPLGLQAAADAAVLDGAPGEAVALLVDAGVPDRAATRWAGAVATRRRAVAVQVAVRRGSVLSGAEARWLVGGDGTAWLLTPAAAPVDPAPPEGEDGDEEERDSLMTVVVAPVGRDDLRRAVADLAPTPDPRRA